MNKLGSVTPPGSSQPQQSSQNTNPFARALAESEKSTYSQKSDLSTDNNLFGETLAKAGGQLPEDANPEEREKWLEQMEEKRKKEQMRQKLHDQVNPVDQEEIFNAQKQRTKKELEEVRKELKKLSEEITKFHKEVDVQVTQQVVEQGREGVGLKSYFQKLRDVIILLTKRVRSARTWMQQQAQANKKKKQQRKVRGGVLAGPGKTNEAKAVFDMMHHERSSAYSGA